MIVGDIMKLSGNFTELTEQDTERIAGGFFFKKICLLKKLRRFCRPKWPIRPPNGPPGKETASLNLSSFSEPLSSDYDSADFFDSDFD